MDAESLVEQGNALHRAGDADGAIACYEAALAAQPRSVRAHYNLGLIRQGRHDLDAAIAHYRRAIDADPAFCPALVNCANALAAKGDSAAALECYRRALAIDPRDPHAVRNVLALAEIFESASDLENALECYRLALAADPGLAVARARAADRLVDLGNLAHAGGDPASAVARFGQALELAPGHATALQNLGTVELTGGHFEAALDALARLLVANPVNPRAQYQSGIALHNLGQLQPALDHFLEAARLDGRFFQPVINAASLLAQMGDPGGARTMNTRALAADDRHLRARAEFGLAHLDLREQDFEGGWGRYEHRLDIEEGLREWEKRGLPRLRERDLVTGTRVAIWSEQGIGDQILFSTLLPELARTGVAALVEVDPRLVEAFERSVDGVRFATPEEFGSAFATCDFQVPLGSLAGLLRNDRGAFARQPPALLKPDPSRVAQMRSRIGAGPRVGISWRSLQPTALKHLENRKSASLERFAAFEGFDTRLVDLQYGDVEAERRAFDAHHPGLRIAVEGLDAMEDLEGVMAAIEACHLVVTTSNATAHLSGAIGKRTWLVYPAANPPFHYWVPGAERRSLWYPSVEIVTDPGWTTWDAAFEAVARRWREELGAGR